MGAAGFESKRFSLRALEKSDVEAVQAYLNEPALVGRRCIPWGIRDVAPLSRRQVEGILEKWASEKKGFTLGIELRETGELVGHAECNWHWDAHCPGIGIAVSPQHQREGIASEVVRLLLAHLFGDTPAHNVSGWVMSWNEAGLTFAKGLGFTESGRIPRSGIREGAYCEAVMVDMLKAEWLAAKGESNGT
ncbi:GNAT family N-acetyltransferase [Candidatus Bipolaricaulota bacterium]